MGEVADMMLDGTLCQQCGVFMGPDWARSSDDWQPKGHPVTCKSCRKDERKKRKPK